MRESGSAYIIHLRENQGLTWDQIGEALGRHPEAVRAEYRRARRNRKRAPERSTFTVDGNEAVAVGGKRIKTLDELVEACAIDLESWRIDRHEINKWELGAVNRDVNLSYVKGKATGHVIKDGLVVEPLFQVKAWLTKRNPEPIEWPAVKAAHIDLSDLPKREPRRIDRLRRAIIFGDTQMGFLREMQTGALEPIHDRAALDIVVQAVELCQPDEVHDNGDGSDLAEWTSRFITSPEFYFTTQPMIYERAWWLAQLRKAAPLARIRVHQGNHDGRIEKALATNLVAACNLLAADMRDDYPVMSLPFLLGLKRMGVEWLGGYPDDVFWLNDALCVLHGATTRADGLDTRAILRDSSFSQVNSHTHRDGMAFASRTEFHRGEIKVVRVLSPGCLCRIDGVVPARKKRNNWQQGFLVIDYNPGGREFTPHFVSIENGRALFDGEILEARDRVAQIRDETNYAF